MNQKKLILFIVLIIAPQMISPIANQHISISNIIKPEQSQPKLTVFTNKVTFGKASHAFDKQGNKVTYLQQYGSEDMLKQFTDESLSLENTDSFGKGLLEGSYSFKQVETSWSYNFSRHWRFEAHTTIQDASIEDIRITLQQKDPLTADQTAYLKKLKNKLPNSWNKFGFSELQLLGVFNHTFENFKHLDFIDLTIKTGFTTPEWTESSSTTLFASPAKKNTHFGYPVSIQSSLGVLDWLTLGCHASAVIYQESQAQVHLQSHATENNLLISQIGTARIHQGPLISTGLFLEADHIAELVSLSLGYTYLYHGENSISPLALEKFPTAYANKPTTLKAWSMSVITLQFEIDFATQDNPNAPIFTLSYSLPIQGKYSAKTSLWTGSCGLQFCYNF